MQTGYDMISPPAVANGTVYVGSDEGLSSDYGTVYAFGSQTSTSAPTISSTPTITPSPIQSSASATVQATTSIGSMVNLVLSGNIPVPRCQTLPFLLLLLQRLFLLC